MEEYKSIADDLSIKWNAADRQDKRVLREEIGDSLYRILGTIETGTGKRYRPVERVDNL